MGAGEQGVFVLYGYIAKFENLLLTICFKEWHFTGMFFGWLSIRLLQLMLIRWKTRPPVGRRFCSIWLLCKFQKFILLRIYSRDFNEILQGCFFGDFLSDSFDSCWSVKNMTANRRGISGRYKTIVQTSKIFFLESSLWISNDFYKDVLWAIF